MTTEGTIMTGNGEAGRNTPARARESCNARGGGPALPVAVAVLAALIELTAAAAEVRAVEVKAGTVAPGFTLATLQGGRISLDDFRGRVALVVFWSSWCSRCREEMAFLETMQEKYPSLAVVAVNAETERPTAADFARIEEVSRAWNHPVTVAVDEGLKVWARYGVNALPTTMIVAPDGTVLFVEANFYWASPENIGSALHAAFATPDDGRLPPDGRGSGLIDDQLPAIEICHRDLCPVEPETHR